MKQPVTSKNNSNVNKNGAAVISMSDSPKKADMARIADTTPANSYEENFPEISVAQFATKNVGKVRIKPTK